MSVVVGLMVGQCCGAVKRAGRAVAAAAVGDA